MSVGDLQVLVSAAVLLVATGRRRHGVGLREGRLKPGLDSGLPRVLMVLGIPEVWLLLHVRWPIKTILPMPGVPLSLVLRSQGVAS